MALKLAQSVLPLILPGYHYGFGAFVYDKSRSGSIVGVLAQDQVAFVDPDLGTLAHEVTEWDPEGLLTAADPILAPLVDGDDADGELDPVSHCLPLLDFHLDSCHNKHIKSTHCLYKLH